MNSLSLHSNSLIHLAPMVGLSHFAVRSAMAEFLKPGQRVLWPTEMLSSRRLPSQREAEALELIFEDKDRGLCPQLLGNEERFICESIRQLESWGAVAVDINMGCPVKKALQHNYGVALMGDADYAAEVTSYAVNCTDLPVSVKLRAGLQGDPEFLVEFARKLEVAGAAWLTLHPRTAQQKRRGCADWSQIKLLKSVLKIPVIGNGDVQSLEDAKSMAQETDCDRVMVGRALLAKPWMISGEEVEPDLQAGLYARFLRRVIEISQSCYPEDRGLRKLRFLLYHSCVWIEFGHYLYAQIKNASGYQEALSIVDEFFSAPRKVYRESELRH